MTEIAFRKDLIERMHGRWLIAIHRESDLNPGIPDLSFVLTGQGHETGWLELKYCAYHKNAALKLKIQSGQHMWMQRYAHRVPSFYFIRVHEHYFLVNGMFTNALAGPVTFDDLKRIATAHFHDTNLVTELTAKLSELTRRDRHES